MKVDTPKGQYVKVTIDWLQMINGLKDVSPESCCDYLMACLGYACRETDVPDFSQHPEWMDYWMRTKIRRADKELNKPGRIDMYSDSLPSPQTRRSQKDLRKLAKEAKEAQDLDLESLGKELDNETQRLGI